MNLIQQKHHTLIVHLDGEITNAIVSAGKIFALQPNERI